MHTEQDGCGTYARHGHGHDGYGGLCLFVLLCRGVCVFFVCLFVCLFVQIRPEKLYSASCWEGSKPPGNDHTRAETQTTFLFVCFFLSFLSWVSKTQSNHWTKRMASTRLATKEGPVCVALFY